jgi:flagellar FliJ protein
LKKFEFSLDRLLRVKRHQERVAEAELARAQQAVLQARATLESFQDQFARISDQFSDAIGRAMTPQQWVSASDLAERLGHSIRTAEQAVLQAEQKMETARQERALIATEVEAIATLRQRRWQQWRLEAAKADQERMDEVGLRLWQQARNDEEAAKAEAEADAAEARTEAVA